MSRLWCYVEPQRIPTMRSREPNLQNIPIQLRHVYFERPDGRYRLATIREVVEAHALKAAGVLFCYLEVEWPPGDGLRTHPCIKVESYGHHDDGPHPAREGAAEAGGDTEGTGGAS